jgi:phage repressor protein C with HTH and peptisase S24 domain
MRPASGGQPSEPGPEFAPVARVLLKVSAGVTGFRVEHMEGNGPPVFFRVDWINARGYKAEKLMALKVSGESMEPGLWDGDLVVINSADTQPTDGEVFVANYEGEVVIKRLERNAGEWWLTSDNPRFKPKKCDEHAELLGRVVYKQSERI